MFMYLYNVYLMYYYMRNIYGFYVTIRFFHYIFGSTYNFFITKGNNIKMIEDKKY